MGSNSVSTASQLRGAGQDGRQHEDRPQDSLGGRRGSCRPQHLEPPGPKHVCSVSGHSNSPRLPQTTEAKPQRTSGLPRMCLGTKSMLGADHHCCFHRRRPGLVRQRAAPGQCRKEGICKGGGDPGSSCLSQRTREPPQNPAPWSGTPKEGLPGSRACRFVFGLLAFAAVLRDRLF